MTIQQHLSQYAAYNLWANQLMIDWLLSKDPAIMEKEVKSSFPTLNKTLSHIWVAEHVWMCRIEGILWKNLTSRHDGQNTKQITDDIILSSTYYIDKLHTTDESELHKNIDYKLLSGDTCKSSIFNVIHHVMNHSTYHRGQLVTMGRELGISDPPKTDFMEFGRLI
jgi:uncharacterized damage-inducible protein DinB